jgi:hypothetical protein
MSEERAENKTSISIVLNYFLSSTLQSLDYSITKVCFEKAFSISIFRTPELKLEHSFFSANFLPRSRKIKICNVLLEKL